MNTSQLTYRAGIVISHLTGTIGEEDVGAPGRMMSMIREIPQYFIPVFDHCFFRMSSLGVHSGSRCHIPREANQLLVTQLALYRIVRLRDFASSLLQVMLQCQPPLQDGASQLIAGLATMKNIITRAFQTQHQTDCPSPRT
ncbi:hypothetical protein F384_06650 [Citrobacter amalonaticus Y19]|uniref:Uncharacterized protein n=1 Tax=Citrobacter amalonaticus Y19 TaxID=1261127 RepID=A0A0F6TUI2_CITAM|nr:hypothetical protein F384_06650 [Citrobacter amalonaticus Y19]